MKIVKNTYGEYEVSDVGNNYNETKQAQPSSRILAGSRDHGYDQEYKGYGEIDGIPVIAVYLLGEDDYNADEDGAEIDEDAGNWDWDNALSNGRIIINIDELSTDAYTILQALAG